MTVTEFFMHHHYTLVVSGFWPATRTTVRRLIKFKDAVINYIHCIVIFVVVVHGIY